MRVLLADDGAARAGAFTEDAIRAGESSFDGLRVPPPDLTALLRGAAALFRHHQTARSEPRQAERLSRKRKTVDRARSILIRERRMADVYRWTRGRAVPSGRRILAVAPEFGQSQSRAKSPRNPQSGKAGTS